MKNFLLLTLLFGGSALAQLEALPDSPLDTSMEGTPEEKNQIINEFERKQEEERQEELLENRYDVPDDEEEKVFNQNGD